MKDNLGGDGKLNLRSQIFQQANYGTNWPKDIEDVPSQGPTTRGMTIKIQVTLMTLRGEE